MNAIHTNWTKSEAELYLKLYTSQADPVSARVHRKLFAPEMDKASYRRVYYEFSKDNDYLCLQKICHNIKKFAYSDHELTGLLAKTQLLFDANRNAKITNRIRMRAMQRLFCTN